MVRRAPLWPCLREAFAFVPRAWAGAWGALALLTCIASSLPLLRPTCDDAPCAVSPAVIAGWVALVFAGGLVLSGALYRLAVHGREAGREGLGYGGLQFARPELRLLGGGALVLLFLLIVAIGLFVAVAILSAAALGEGGQSDRGSATAVRVFNLAAWAVLAILYVRLSLFAPAVVGRRRVVSLDALAIAQGAFWTLLFGLAVCLLPTGLLIAGLSTPAIVDSVGATAALVGVAVWLVFVQAPLLAGFLSAAYKRLEYVDDHRA